MEVIQSYLCIYYANVEIYNNLIFRVLSNVYIKHISVNLKYSRVVNKFYLLL